MPKASKMRDTGGAKFEFEIAAKMATTADQRAKKRMLRAIATCKEDAYNCHRTVSFRHLLQYYLYNQYSFIKEHHVMMPSKVIN